MIHNTSKPERRQPSKEYFFFQGNKHKAMPTKPKQQTIQELTNIVTIKPLDILFIRAFFRSRIKEFKADKLKHCFHKWKELTSDKEILQTVLGLKLEFWLNHQKSIIPIFFNFQKNMSLP